MNAKALALRGQALELARQAVPSKYSTGAYYCAGVCVRGHVLGVAWQRYAIALFCGTKAVEFRVETVRE